jgi:hypothetical protein
MPVSPILSRVEVTVPAHLLRFICHTIADALLESLKVLVQEPLFFQDHLDGVWGRASGGGGTVVEVKVPSFGPSSCDVREIRRGLWANRNPV